MGRKMLEIAAGGGMVYMVPGISEDDGPPPGISYAEWKARFRSLNPQLCEYCSTTPKWDGDNRCSNCGAPRPSLRGARIKEVDVTGLTIKQREQLATRLENTLSFATQKVYE